MNHIEISAEETRRVLNDTACTVLLLDIALTDKELSKFTAMVLKTAKAKLKITAALINKMHHAITALLRIISQ